MFTSQAPPTDVLTTTTQPSAKNESPPVVPGLTYESYTLMRYPQMQMPMMNGYASDPSAVPRFPTSDPAPTQGYMAMQPQHANGNVAPHMSPYAVQAGYHTVKSSYAPSHAQSQNYAFMAPVSDPQQQYMAGAGPVKAEYAQHPYLFQGARCELPEQHRQRPGQDDGSSRSSSSSAPTKKHFCCYCGKGFIRPSALQTHIYSHTGEKPFTCTEANCNKSFSVVSNLRRHMKIHEKT